MSANFKKGVNMAIAPNSVIHLLTNVPIDISYRNTIHFNGSSEQASFFIGYNKYTLQEYTYVRKEQKLRVGILADNLLDCNYIMFQNSSFGTKWIYGFITNIEYVNDSTSNITFVIDVMQTWYFNYTLLPSFVEREHSLTDNIGDNLVPDNLELGEYKYTDLGLTSLFSLYQIVIASTFDKNFEDSVGGLYGGVYSGLSYNVFSSYELANDFITEATEKNLSDGIVSIFMLPIAFCVDTETVGPELYNIDRDKHIDNIDGYVPKNKKLFTHPYNTLYVTNNEGGAANFPFEYFSTSNCQFNLSGAMCCTPECMIVPLNYKGVLKNYNEKLTIGNFPQCAYAIDTFKAFVAQNSNRLMFEGGTALAQTVAGGAVMYATGGALGSGMTLGGIEKVGSLVATVADKSTLPPQARGGNSSIINMANQIKGFQFYYANVRAEFARIIDEYWNVYGYPSHRVKIPNISNRPHWNYVKLVEANIKGNCPSDDLAKIKDIYNKGITFWKNGNEVGNYALDNSV